MIVALIPFASYSQAYLGHPSKECYERFRQDSVFFEWSNHLIKSPGNQDSLESIMRDSMRVYVFVTNPNKLKTHHKHGFSFTTGKMTKNDINDTMAASSLQKDMVETEIEIKGKKHKMKTLRQVVVDSTAQETNF